jgi:hypothetical protein
MNNPETLALVEEAKMSCMLGMLLCLERDQRIILLLGEIIGCSDRTGVELLDISRENFRKKLSRTRRDLYNFMNEKCGLINVNNSCRCQRKTRGFIKAGWVDPNDIKFSGSHYNSVRKFSEENYRILDEYCQAGYTDLWQEIPMFSPPGQLIDEMMAGLNIFRKIDGCFINNTALGKQNEN